jgi:hypothetical protein
MAVNHKSGRVVVDLDPEFKMALHAVLASKGMSLKQWFTSVAAELVAEHRQPKMAFNDGLSPAADLGAGGPGADPRTA